LGYVLLIIAYLLRGFNNSIILRSIPFPHAVTTAGCTLVGAIVMFLYIGRKRWHETVAAVKTHPLHFVGLAMSSAGTMLVFQWAIGVTTIANVMLTSAIQPLLTTLVFVPLWGGNRPTRLGWIALLIGVVGMGIVFVPQASAMSGAPFYGMMLGLASVTLASWFNVQLPYFHGKVPTDVTQTVTMACTALLLAPLWTTADTVKFSMFGLGALVLLGVLWSAANLMHYSAYEHVSVGRASIFAYLQPSPRFPARRSGCMNRSRRTWPSADWPSSSPARSSFTTGSARGPRDRVFCWPRIFTNALARDTQSAFVLCYREKKR
jgi:drug/metabolite transporter (DMT)-like permease